MSYAKEVTGSYSIGRILIVSPKPMLLQSYLRISQESTWDLARDSSLAVDVFSDNDA